jgi:tRNA G18 (ribose-2'-O)-methylase SpoU
VKEIIVIAHNIRSTHNVGSIFRTAEGFGVTKLILSGYTPAPHFSGDTRLPHISDKLAAQIHKTALGAEKLVSFEIQEFPNFTQLTQAGYHVVGLDQDPRSISLSSFDAPEKIALIIGEEVEGIAEALRSQCETILEIPMSGKKESFNVSVATGIALYALTT